MPQGSFKADLDTFLRMLAKTADWEPPHVTALTGKQNSGLTELRWTSGKIEHRIIGYRLPDEGQVRRYLMLIGCTHKGGVYAPPDAIATARTRRELLKMNRATTSEYPLIANR
jgi:hypothetical protein